FRWSPCGIQCTSIQQLQSLKDPDLVAPGGTITMSCRYNGGTITDDNYPRWIQQKAGETPRLLIHSTSRRVSGVPDRFSGSRSGNTMSLTITGALLEDEATYYCLGAVKHYKAEYKSKCYWHGSSSGTIVS
uniref:Ig-like domain-containing protein n=1 Tax=Naja naja TaxID=35670 RepID=A0A8C6VL46_NAJNA